MRSHSLHLLRFKYCSHQTRTELRVPGLPWYLNFCLIPLKPNVPTHNQHLFPDPSWPFPFSSSSVVLNTQFCTSLNFVPLSVCTKFLLPDSHPSLSPFFSFKTYLGFGPYFWIYVYSVRKKYPIYFNMQVQRVTSLI